jgi:hypothetical protein
MALFSGIAALILAVIHIFGGMLRFLDVLPRSRWLSFAGGVSVAYVFIHILPELAEYRETITEHFPDMPWLSVNPVFLIALGGLVFFYGLENYVQKSHRKPEKLGGLPHEKHSASFAVRIGSFAIYNAIVGYLLTKVETTPLSLLFFALALGLHFLVNDYGLRKDHKQAYQDLGRWILAASVIVGWVIGLIAEVHEVVISVLFSILAGGIILNVLKEELPEDRESRFSAFAAGAVLYSIVLLLVQ